MNFHGEIAAGNGFRDSSHFTEVLHHVVEGAGQFTHFVAGVDLDSLVEVAGVGNLSGNHDELCKRLSDRLS